MSASAAGFVAPGPLGPLLGTTTGDHYWWVVWRRSLRHTSFSPLQVSSMAHTLVSTRPIGRATSRTTCSVMSVVIRAARLGQAIQATPAGAMAWPIRSMWPFQLGSLGREEQDQVAMVRARQIGHDRDPVGQVESEPRGSGQQGQVISGFQTQFVDQRSPGIARHRHSLTPWMSDPHPTRPSCWRSGWSGRRGEQTPGRVMANMKTGGLRDLLESLATGGDHDEPLGLDAETAASWTPIV